MKFMWTAPLVDISGAPITNYMLTLTPADGSPQPYNMGPTSNDCTVIGIVLGVEYMAGVKASSDNGATYGPEAAFKPFTLYPTMPTAPANGGFMYMSPTEVNLSWSPPTDDGGRPITRYQLIFVPSEGVPYSETLDDSVTYYSLKDLQHGITVHASVKATNNNGMTYGPEFQFAPIIPIVPPAAPVSSAEAVGVSPGVVKVSWSAPVIPAEGAAYYMIMSQSSNPADPYVGLGTKDMTDLSGCLRELNPESSYTFTVQIVNQVGRSTIVTTNEVPPTKDLPAPAATEPPAAEPPAAEPEPPTEAPPA